MALASSKKPTKKGSTAKKAPARKSSGMLGTSGIKLTGRTAIVAAAGIALIAAVGVRLVFFSSAATGWSSGVSAVDPGPFGTWRGSTATIYGCWADHFPDTAAAQDVNNCLQDPKDGGWKYDIDIAPGMLSRSKTETFADAAAGKYDARWKEQITAMYNNWGTTRTMYIRPAHEMNGDWYAWSVTSSNVAKFREAYCRYAGLVKTGLKDKGKDAKMVLSFNWDGNNSRVSIDSIYPGDSCVDVIGVDRYDVNYQKGNPGHNTTEADWQDVLTYNDKAGNYGLNNWSAWAKSHGKPMAFPEWGVSDKDPDDNPFWITKMHDFMAANAGTGPGQVLYDIYFNVANFGDNGQTLAIYPNAEAPQSAARYKSLKWGSGTATATQPPTSTLPPTSTQPPAATPTPATAAKTFTGSIQNGLGTSSQKKCIDNSANNNIDYNKIQLWNCNGSSAQVWTVTNQAGARIVNAKGKCLHASGSNKSAGTSVILFTCNSAAGQKWTYNTSNAEIKNVNSGLCLNVKGSNPNNGTALELANCNGSASQKWPSGLQLQ